MKANELRIGDLITFGAMRHECKPCDILNLYQSEITGTQCDEYQPIPITEEWLVRFGFEIIKWNALVSTQYYLPIPDSDKNISFLVRGRKLDTGSVIRLPHEHGTVYFDLKIEYVHQLQNLYFALTGQELTTQEEQK